MAYRVQGVVRIDNSGNINSGILTATSINSTGVATATEFDGKVSAKAITEQTEGAESDVTGADEVLIYDVNTTDLLRVTVDEFIGGSGIGTIVTNFNELNVTGVVTAANVIVSAGGSVTTEYVKTVSFESTGVSTVGFLTATDVWVGGAITATSFFGNGSGLTNIPAAAELNDIGDVSVANAGIGSALVWNGTDWVAATATNISPAGAMVLNYRFSNNTSMADPGVGRIRVNNANQYQATALAVDVEVRGTFGNNGNNVALLLLEAKKGSRLLLQNADNPNQVTEYLVTEDPTQQGTSTTGWISFGAVEELNSTQQNISNNTNSILAILFPNQLSNVTINPDHVNTPSILVSGISTLGTVKVESGIVTATSGIVTYYGDGSNLAGIGVTELNDIGDVSVTNVGIGSALVWNGTDWVGNKATNISPAGALVINYRFSNNTTMADPGSGFLRVNNANQYQATAMAIDVDNWGFFGFGGSNMSLLLLEATRGTRILLQASEDPTEVTQYVVNEDPVLVGGSTGYVSFPSVTSLVSTQQNIPNNTNCMIAIQFPDQATNVTISPDHVNTPSIVVSGIATLNTIDAGVGTSYVSISTSLVPSVNDAVSLGSSERQWKDLWVSGGTIYVGGVAMTGAGSTVYVGQQPIVVSSTDGSISAGGSVSAGTTFYGNGSGLTNVPDPSLTLNDLTNVSVDSPSNDEVLRYESLSSSWGSESVTDLLLNQNLDVSTLEVQNGFSGSAFVPQTSLGSDLGGTILSKYWKDLYIQSIQMQAGPTWTSGSGTPEGSVTASVGSMYTRTDGGVGTTLYVKESGTGNTGWVSANPAVAGPNYNQVIVDTQEAYTTNTSTFVAMTALDITITPTNTDSLIEYSLNLNVGQGIRSNGYNVQRKIGAGSFTNISQLQGTGTPGSQGFLCSFSGGNDHDNGGTQIVSNISFGFIDEWHNTTSEITYRITVRTTEAAGGATINENRGLTDRSVLTTSVVTVKELK